MMMRACGLAVGWVFGVAWLNRVVLSLLLVTIPSLSRGDQPDSDGGSNYEQDLGALVRRAQASAVKIYGAGGGGLVAYQSGFLVSPLGHVATAWSHVLDVEPVVVLDDGRRFPSKIVGFEPRLDLAVLKIEAEELPYLELAPELPELADPILAISNLFGIASGDEPASVMKGAIAAITRLDARRGTFKTPYTGTVLILDLVANNPGAAGGAVIAADGRAVGMLGKELRDASAGVWLNYALPSQVLREAIANIVAGRAVVATDNSLPVLPRERSHNPTTLGLSLIPNVLEITPAFVDRVLPSTPAARADIRADDLILLVGNTRIDSQRTFIETLRRIDRRDPVVLTLQRGPRIVSARLEP